MAQISESTKIKRVCIHSKIRLFLFFGLTYFLFCLASCKSTIVAAGTPLSMHIRQISKGPVSQVPVIANDKTKKNYYVGSSVYKKQKQILAIKKEIR